MQGIDIQMLFDAGAHVGYSRTRRHPTAAKYLFGTKDAVDVFDLERTQGLLDAARAFIVGVATSGKQVLFVGGKPESASLLKTSAESVGMPYVASRWIGGTLTNFKNIRQRIDLLLTRVRDRDSGALAKYTKRERLLIDREIDELLNRFGGLVTMNDLPAALFVVDTRHENTAVREANQLNIPVVGLSSSDCNFSEVKYPIPANDTSIRSVRFVCEEMAEAYKEGKRQGASKQKIKSDYK